MVTYALSTGVNVREPVVQAIARVETQAKRG
jgi:hypothetical protein